MPKSIYLYLYFVKHSFEFSAAQKPSLFYFFCLSDARGLLTKVEKLFSQSKLNNLFFNRSYLSSFRFQGQQLYKANSSSFRMAIEEAFLAEHGIFDVQFNGPNTDGQPTYNQSIPKSLQEVTDSNNDQECQSQIQARNSYLYPQFHFI